MRRHLFILDKDIGHYAAAMVKLIDAYAEAKMVDAYTKGL